MTYLAVTCALVLSGCGVSTQDQPNVIDPPPGQVPLPASTAPSTPDAGAAAEPLYFVRHDRLVAVIRRVRIAPTMQQQMQHLLAGPTDAERAAGMSSTLNGNIIVADVSLNAGKATISIGDDTDESRRKDQVLAFGQIVCTLTARPEVATVSFHHDGQPLGVPRADGSLSTGGLTAADYTALTAPA